MCVSQSVIHFLLSVSFCVSLIVCCLGLHAPHSLSVLSVSHVCHFFVWCLCSVFCRCTESSPQASRCLSASRTALQVPRTQSGDENRVDMNNYLSDFVYSVSVAASSQSLCPIAVSVSSQRELLSTKRPYLYLRYCLCRMPVPNMVWTPNPLPCTRNPKP